MDATEQSARHRRHLVKILTFMEQWQLSASSTFPCEEGEATRCWIWTQQEADENDPGGATITALRSGISLPAVDGMGAPEKANYVGSLAGNRQAHRPAGPWRETARATT